MAGSGRTTPGPSADAHRRRLLGAVLQVVATKGYADTTIGDVVARAMVSRRTFYECFADKEECFVAAYEGASKAVLRRIDEAVDPRDDWVRRLETGVGVYLAAVAANPSVITVFVVEIMRAGPRALAARRRAYRRWAAVLGQVSERAAMLGEDMWQAALAAINERVLIAAERQEVSGDAVRADVMDVLLSLLTAPGRDSAP